MSNRFTFSISIFVLIQCVLLAFWCASCDSDGAQVLSSYVQSLQSNLDKAKSLPPEDIDEALAIYKQISTVIVDSTQYAQVAPIVYDALDQIADIHDDINDKEPILEWLLQLRSHPTALIQNCAMCDLNSTIVSLYYQQGEMKKAAQYMDAAMSDSMYFANPERRFRDNVRCAQIYMPVDETPDRVIACLEAAEQWGSQCSNVPRQMSFVRSFLGTLYNWQGNIERAFEVFNDNLAQSLEECDTIGQIYAYNALSNIYSFWQLYDDANQNSQEAVLLVQKGDFSERPSMVSDTYMLKAKALMEICPDSVPVFISLAENVNSGIPYEMGPEDIDFLAGEWAYKYKGDYDEAIKRFTRYAENVPPIKRHSAYFWLARIQFDTGHPVQGERMLDSLSHYSRLVEGIPTASRDALEYCLGHYAALGNGEKTMLYANALVRSDFYERDKVMKKQFASAIIDFRLRHAREAINLATLEAEVSRSHLITGIWLALTVVALVFIVGSYFYRRLQIRHQEELHKNELLQSELNDQIQLTNSARKGLEVVKNDIETRSTIEHLYPIQLKEKGEAWFTNRFHLLYPGFEHNLNKLGISIGKREQVMCMLFILGQNSAEVASTLAIARTSVNVARYRLRKKLRLDNHTSLDDYLVSIANGQPLESEGKA